MARKIKNGEFVGRAINEWLGGTNSRVMTGLDALCDVRGVGSAIDDLIAMKTDVGARLKIIRESVLKVITAHSDNGVLATNTDKGREGIAAIEELMNKPIDFVRPKVKLPEHMRTNGALTANEVLALKQFVEWEKAKAGETKQRKG